MSNAVQILNSICGTDKKTSRENILQWESLALTAPQLDIPVTNTIHGGMYARKIVVPKDSIITGDIYKFDHIDIMVSGDITLSSDNGVAERFKGHNIFSCNAGKKRAAYIHEETIWITLHPFTGSSGDDIQELITVKSFDELEYFNIILNQADYNTISHNFDCVGGRVVNHDYLLEAKSCIHEWGLFSMIKIDKGDDIGLLSDIGGSINHALQPNSTVVITDDGEVVRANRDIWEEEITLNYRFHDNQISERI